MKLPTISPIAWLFVMLVQMAGLFLPNCSIAQETPSSQPVGLERFEYEVPTMGTMLQIVLYAADIEAATKAIEAATDEMDRLAPIVSNYDSQSEIMRLCRTHGEWQVISADLYEILLESKRWYVASEGKFDITFGPAIQAWRQARKSKQIPAPKLLEELKPRMGWHHVEMSADGEGADAVRRVRLNQEGMYLDLSGIATGFIIDRAFEKIEALGIESALINIGGDIRLGKAPPNSIGWKVQIAGLGKDSPPLAIRMLQNCAITTSGDLTQFVEIDGRRYSHLFDPSAMSPLMRRQSATVIAATTIDADAGATAVSIMGMKNASRSFDSLPLLEAILLELEERSPLVAAKNQPDTPVVRYRHLQSNK